MVPINASKAQDMATFIYRSFPVKSERIAQKPIMSIPRISRATVRSGGVGPAPILYKQKKQQINKQTKKITINAPDFEF